MLNETTTNSSEYQANRPTPPPTRTESPLISNLNQAVQGVMLIHQTIPAAVPQIVAQYAGQLTLPSAEAYDKLEHTLIQLGVHAYFDHHEERDHITIIKGRFDPKPRPWWPNALLLFLTLLSLLLVGASIQAGIDDQELNSLADLQLWKGLPYALSMILILGAHELGHYFAARHHKVSVTLPYFIPMPLTLFGTLGAFIQLREPMRNRRQLFDVGVAGPLAGLFFAIPILFIGLATSNVETIPTDIDTMREGNSLFYAAAKYTIFGQLLPDGNEDVFINQLAQAGWTGLFITALNLIPLGQLDGGHVLYSLFGNRARKLYWPMLGLFAILAMINSAWILWTVLLFFFGRMHAKPLEDITPLDSRRRLIGYLALIILVLTFTPNPIQFVPAQ